MLPLASGTFVDPVVGTVIAEPQVQEKYPMTDGVNVMLQEWIKMARIITQGGNAHVLRLVLPTTLRKSAYKAIPGFASKHPLY
jgi:hypothetical protein